MTDAFVDVHVLHAVPFSNLNRDNIGSPKSMTFGGVTRSRISSQCTKRAARLWLETSTDLDRALRTRRLPQTIREELVGVHEFDDEEARELVKTVFSWVGKKGVAVEEVGEEGSRVLQSTELTFTSAEAAAGLARSIVDHIDTIRETLGASTTTAPKSPKAFKKELEDHLCRHNTIIALCGRMLANLPGSNVDGALQVAHAFTTHASSPELDYFTAVDDELQEDDEETGAGHINVNEFTSGVFYRHATVGLGTLVESLDGSAEATAQTVASFVKAFTLAEPTGKQNAANAHTRPALVAVTLRSDRPVSLAAAFEKPVTRSADGGYMDASINRLASHAAHGDAFYGTDAVAGAWFAADPACSPSAGIEGLGSRCDTHGDLVDTVERSVKDAL